MESEKEIKEIKDKFYKAEELLKINPKESLDDFLLLFHQLPKCYVVTTIYLDLIIAIASNYDDLSIFNKGEEFYLKALKLAQDNHSRDKESKIYNGLGIIYRKQNEYSKSLDCHLKSLKIRKKLNLQKDCIISYNNIGILYRTLKDYDNALVNLKEAYSLAKKTNDKVLLVASLNNLGLIYYSLDKIEASLSVHKEALIVVKTFNDKKMLADTYNNLGLDYGVLEDLKSAKNYYDEALKLYEDLHNDRGRCRIILNYGISASKVGNYFLSIKIIEESLEIAQAIHYTDLLHRIYEHLSKIYAITKDFKNAYLYSQKAYEIRDELYRKNLLNEVATIRNNFEIAQKEQEKEIFRLKNVELAKAYDKLQEINKSKDKLFSIIAHDLRNPLNSILGIVQIVANHKDKLNLEKMYKYVDMLSRSSHNLAVLIENLLKWANFQTGHTENSPDFYDIEEVIENNINLLELAAFNKTIVFENKVKKETFAYFDKDLISTVVRNLLSNALKFSFEKSKIIIKDEYDNHFLKISIEDFGVGIDKQKISDLFKITEKSTTLGTNKEKGSGLGLILCKDFVEKSNGKLEIIRKEDKGLIISFTLPTSKS